MKYKKLYEDLKNEHANTRFQLMNARVETEKEQKKNRELEQDIVSLRTFIRSFEGKESDVRRENEWLKTTLRLVIVDAGKIAGLAKELERNQHTFDYKL